MSKWLSSANIGKKHQISKRLKNFFRFSTEQNLFCLSFSLSFLSVVFLSSLSVLLLSYPFVCFSDKKRALRIDSFPRRPTLLWFLWKSACFCKLLIDNILWIRVHFVRINSFFFLQNSLENFWSKRYFDAVISLIWPCHLAILIMSFKRDDSIKVPFCAQDSASVDGKSQFCRSESMNLRFCFLYIASERGGYFVKKLIMI